MTTLQQAAIRQSFEAWKKDSFYMSRNNTPGSDLDGYQDAYTQGQWVTWQAALAQQVQEPTHERVYETIIQWDEGGGKRSRRELARRIEALYAAAPQAQPVTDGEVLKAFGDKARLAFDQELRKSQAQPVQPVAQEQIQTLLNDFMDSSDERLIQFARDIEKLHGIKKAAE